MKKLMTALSMVLLLTLTFGVIPGPTGNFMSVAKAATQSPIQELGPSINNAIDLNIPKVPINEATPTPKFHLPNFPGFEVTKLPLLPHTTPEPTSSSTAATAVPKDSTPNPSTGGGKYMTSEGPLFLSFRYDLTEQFYMFTPMDLSLDGEYHFPLVGSTEQIVGEAKVVVNSGMAIVSYLLVNGVKLDDDDEFFTFFSDINSVETVRPSKLQSVKLKFGVPYSVANWLNSDFKVLLYINCPISYKTSLKGLTDFSFDDALYLQRVIELVQLMD